MLFSLAPEQTVCFLKPVGEAGLLHQSLAALCCFCSMLWKPAGKSMPLCQGLCRDTRKVTPCLKESLVKKDSRRQQIFFTLFHVVSSILYLSILSAVFSSMFALYSVQQQLLIVLFSLQWQSVLYAGLFFLLSSTTKSVLLYAVLL